MEGIVNIGGKDVKMVANGATPVLFKRVFKKDFLVESQQKNLDPNLFQELGFVMAMQGQKKTQDLLKEISIDQYYDWLEGFGATDIITKVNEIFAIYFGQNVSLSESKKN